MRDLLYTVQVFRKKIRVKIVKRKKHKSDAWKIYKNRAKILVEEIINEKFSGYKLKYNRITIRDQKTRWGSCSSKNNLNFNYRILFLPRDLSEYLVAHELCHLHEMNHSKKYWTLLQRLVPNYKILQKKLKTIDMSRLIR